MDVPAIYVDYLIYSKLVVTFGYCKFK